MSQVQEDIRRELAQVAGTKEANQLAPIADMLVEVPKFTRPRTTHATSWRLIEDRIEESHHKRSWRWWQLAVVPAVLLVLIGVAFAAQNALPGDATYSIKRKIENVQIALALSPAKKADICSIQMKRRANELALLSSAKLQTRTVKQMSDAILGEAKEFSEYVQKSGTASGRLKMQQARDASYVIEALKSTAQHTSQTDQIKIINDTSSAMQNIITQNG